MRKCPSSGTIAGADSCVGEGPRNWTAGRISHRDERKPIRWLGYVPLSGPHIARCNRGVPGMSEEQASKAGPEDSSDTNIDPAEAAHFVQAVVKQHEDEEVQRLVAEHINALVKKYGVDNYKIVLLFDENDTISSWHSNRIYSAATSGPQKDILLLIQSTGGSIEPAYLISKTCRRRAKDKFVAVVPRRAKSAATLIALGANEIHMGLMSELGPIDPQFGGLPALSMQNALTLLADLSCKYPGSSQMLGKFLAEKLDLRILGYFDRINGSAIQYAERLLDGNEFAPNQTPKTLADHFVN